VNHSGTKNSALFLYLLWVICFSAAQPPAIVSHLEGEVSVLHSGLRNPDILRAGTSLRQQDILETSAQSRCVVTIEGKGGFILSAASKIIYAYQQNRTADSISLRLRLLQGAILSWCSTGCQTILSSPHGSVRVDRGKVSVVINQKNNITAFQAIEGTDIVVQKETEGDTLSLRTRTYTLTGPQVPSLESFDLQPRHITILQDLFASHTARNSPAKTTVPPPGYEKERFGGSITPEISERTNRNTDSIDLYKKLFALNEMYGNLFTEANKNRKGTAQLDVEEVPSDRQSPIEGTRRKKRTVSGQIGLEGALALAPNTSQPALTLLPTLDLGHFTLSLRINLASNYDGIFGIYGFSSGIAGIADFIDSIQFEAPQQRFTAYLGPLREYTVDDGFLVQEFSNQNRYSLLQTAGLKATTKIGTRLSLELFTSDITDFTVGGLYTHFRIGKATGSVGYVYDYNPLETVSHREVNRYRLTPLDDRVIDRDQAHHFATAGLTVPLITGTQSSGSGSGSGTVSLRGQYMHKLYRGKDGFAAQFPTIAVSLAKHHFGGGFTLETGKARIGLFNWAYATLRHRTVDTTASGITTAALADYRTISFLDMYPPSRISAGLNLFYQGTPLRGVTIAVDGRGDVYAEEAHRKKISPGDTSSSDYDTLFFTRIKTVQKAANRLYSYTVALTIDSTLAAPLQQIRLYARQYGVGLYPDQSILFGSWTFNTGFSLTTKALFDRFFISSGLDFYFLELSGSYNDTIETSDRIFEIHCGLHWRFGH